MNGDTGVAFDGFDGFDVVKTPKGGRIGYTAFTGLRACLEVGMLLCYYAVLKLQRVWTWGIFETDLIM
ncbi:hypothetical protein P280DRAFT_78575 [Massarina eburnea CBS 473.64]|uniref:Uncharacterized protein n=1 Tax=Massarina eburnea CBS 473.64 TaxID=1395130 RepID=A0A6A6RRX5_9PLEO|nr:hypothetical protein P280DRAFT_78575 [Massarina eburnea CBS 473.64]